MTSFKALALTTVILLSAAFVTPIETQAGRVRVTVKDEDTVGGASAGYNPETGARYGRSTKYNSETGAYQKNSGAYNPETGRGFTKSTSAAPEEGITTEVNTVNNGSYDCTVSKTDPADCESSD